MTEEARSTAGIPGRPLGPWRTSSFSGNVGTCVEVAPAAGGVLVRNSNDPGGATVHFTQAELRVFLLGAKAGEFDDLAAPTD